MASHACMHTEYFQIKLYALLQFPASYIALELITSLGSASNPRFWSSCNNHFFVVLSSFSVTENVLSFSCSGRHCRSASLALGDGRGSLFKCSMECSFRKGSSTFCFGLTNELYIITLGYQIVGGSIVPRVSAVVWRAPSTTTGPSLPKGHKGHCNTNIGGRGDKNELCSLKINMKGSVLASVFDSTWYAPHSSTIFVVGSSVHVP